MDLIGSLRLVTEAALASPWLPAVILAMAVVDALVPVVPTEALIIAAGVAAATGGQHLLAVIARRRPGRSSASAPATRSAGRSARR